MDREVVALSASEEITLKRVSYGIAKPGEMLARDLDRLTTLGLVVRRGPNIVLTSAGQQQWRRFSGHDEPFSKLLNLLTRAAR
jgi:hypothetical protein